MKKYISAITIAILIFINFSPVLAINSTSAQNYLSAHAVGPWSIMALSALGATGFSTDLVKNISSTSAIGYAAPILAITSLGEDARTYDGTDYIAALESYHQSSQLGDSALLNDDIFGVLALQSAGINDAVVADSVNFIIQHQNSDGGWGFSVNGLSDTNTTAAAVLALLSAGKSASDPLITQAVTYLRQYQNTDGGFSYDITSNAISDVSSTAWVLWSINRLGDDLSGWAKNSNTPVSYLTSQQQSDGYFGTVDNSFTPVTTAYATIALTGKYLPIRTLASQPKYDFRIEGSSAQVCAGRAVGPTALDVLTNASAQCGFTYNLTTTAFGPYLNKINNDIASGNTGWMYMVNYKSPEVGAGDYAMRGGDSVLWFFGEYNWIPILVTLSGAQVSSGQSVSALVESFGEESWTPLSGATVVAGSTTAETDSNGRVSLNLSDGYYKVYAKKAGAIRSDLVPLQVGTPISNSASLSADIVLGQVLGDDTATVAFNINTSALDFGRLNPGSSTSKNVTISNTGEINITVATTVAGDSLFKDNVTVASTPWRNFSSSIAKTESKQVAIGLRIPADYSNGGQKSGSIIFWAMAQ